MKNAAYAAVLSLAVTLSAPLRAQDAVSPADAVAAAGQDLPKVLYIVPWKDTEIGPPLPPPQVRLDEAALSPVNRDAFRQRLRY